MANQEPHERLYKVTGRILARIPPDFENYMSLSQEIAHLRAGLFYKAPECGSEQWAYLCGLLERYVGDPAGRPWAEKIVALAAARGIEVGGVR